MTFNLSDIPTLYKYLNIKYKENIIDTYEIIFNKKSQDIELMNKNTYIIPHVKIVRVLFMVSNITNINDFNLYSDIILDNNLSLYGIKHDIPLYSYSRNKYTYINKCPKYQYCQKEKYKFNIDIKLYNDEYIKFYIQVHTLKEML